MNFTGQKVLINTGQQNAFEFLGNFNNFEKLMPDQVTNWKSDVDTCSFDIQGMTSISLKYSNKIASHLIEIVPEGKSPISFSLQFNIEQLPENDGKSMVWIKIDADLNPMIAMIAKRPLENLVNVMSEKLKTLF